MTSIDDVIVDVTTNEEHTYDNDVTSHPVESGSDITDNVINKPLLISMDCTISNTPIQASGFTLLSGTVFAATPVEAARARLLAINATREPVTVVDLAGTFPNMVLEKLSFSVTPKTGNALSFKVSFRELKIITNERTVIEVAIPRAQAESKRGTKSSKAPPDPPITDKAKDKRSALRRVVNTIAPGFVGTRPNKGGS